MGYNKMYGDIAETSQQGTLNMMQQDLQGHVEGANGKIDKLQAAIERLLIGMEGMVRNKSSTEEEFEEVQGEFVEVNRNKGVFRDPAHAAWARQQSLWAV